LADEDRLSVNLDDIQDEVSDEDTIDLTKSAAAAANTGASGAASGAEEAKDYVNTSGSDEQNKSTGGSSGSGSGASSGNLFAVGESQDKGLADIETGSEVYMSELLAGFDMEDFDEAEETNEEDLISLGDEFAKIDLVSHVKNQLNEFICNAEQGS